MGEAERDVDVLAGRELERRAAVDVDLDGFLARGVVDRELVAGGDDERAGRQRMWGDERDDVALDAPGQDGAAVGEVVAGGALRGGDDEAVAADAADLLARQRVGEVGDAQARPAVDGDVVEGVPGAVGRPTEIVGQLDRVEFAGEGAFEVARRPSGSIVARKPTSP